MKGYVYQTEFARKYVAQGRAEGLTEGRIEGRIEGRTEGRIEGRVEGRIEGRLEGRIEEAARNLLAVLRVRGLVEPDPVFNPMRADPVRESILAEKDPERLERWLEKAAVATSANAILDEPN